MSGFGDAYTAWRKHPFPVGDADELLDELHADLALADAWVAEAVIPFIERGIHQPVKVDIVAELDKLRARACELALRTDVADRGLAAEYREYVDLLEDVYKGFLADS